MLCGAAIFWWAHEQLKEVVACAREDDTVGCDIVAIDLKHKPKENCFKPNQD